MPVTLSQLTANRAECDVHVGEGVLHVVYRPSAISPAAFHRVLEADAPLVGPDGDEPTAEQVLAKVDAAVRILAPVLDSWDLEEPDPVTGEPSGRPIPLTAETLSELGVSVLWAIIREVFGESRVNPTTASDGPRQSLATSAPSRRPSSGKPASRTSRRR